MKADVLFSFRFSSDFDVLDFFFLQIYFVSTLKITIPTVMDKAAATYGTHNDELTIRKVNTYGRINILCIHMRPKTMKNFIRSITIQTVIRHTHYLLSR